MSWTDPRVPVPRDCVLRELVDRWAEHQPEKAFATFDDGSPPTSYAALRRRARQLAAGLAALGVAAGEHVLVWLPNGREALEAWFGINYLGAVCVPVNFAYRGGLLTHVVRDSGARVAIGHATLLDRLEPEAAAQLARIVVVGGVGTTDASATANPAPGRSAFEALSDHGEFEATLPLMPWDLQQIIYTSGTTGPSKGVLCTYAKAVAAGALAFGYLGPDDIHLVNLPLFHVAGTGAVYNVLRVGATIAMTAPFTTSTFWQTVQRTGSTAITLMGVMATFLVKQPPGPQDREHRLRSVMMVPLSENAEAFARRFDCDVYTVFNMTETSCPLVSGRNPAVTGSCGRVRPGIEARLVDANDCEVADGAVGELVLRSDRPWSMTTGYLNRPEATAALWRNGWLHTGDAFKRDAAGNYFFVDRLKDAIRRRGENISSFEVEAEVCTYPAVEEAAAFAVPSELGEDEVMVVVAVRNGASWEPAALLEYLQSRMGGFMIPRYVRTVASLPKTPTQKVQKHLLRTEGVTADTFDRQAAGMSYRRESV